MKPSLFLLAMALTLMSCQPGKTKKQSDFPEPPHPAKRATELIEHGDVRIDNYYWLNQRENPEVIDYLKAENTYLDTVMGDTRDLQESLFNEIVGRIKQDDETVPYLDNGYYYYSRFVKGKEYPIYCRKMGSLDSSEEILLDVNNMADGYAYFQVTGLSVSPDNQYLVYGVDTVSRRKYTLHVKNLTTGFILDDAVSETTGGASWANDNLTFFYTRKDPETLRSEKIFRHTLGKDAGLDPLIYNEVDETFSTRVSRTKSGQYLFISSFSTLSSEYRFLSSDDPFGRFIVVQPREQDLEYSVDHFGDSFFIRTNSHAPNFKLVKAPVTEPGVENWVDVIPHRMDAFFEGVELFKDFMVVDERIKGLTKLRIVSYADQTEHDLDFGEETYAASISVNRYFNSHVLRYNYSSLTTPASTFDYNMDTQERELLKQQEVLGGFISSNYESKRLYAIAGDGTEIPISIVYRKGIRLDGNNPTLLYGYGSYGSSMNPNFSPVRLSLLDRGFVFALAHIRGGQEMGRSWYEDGKLLKKKNTFTDFIDVARFLIQEKYTSPDWLFAQGGSAGGLLVGAVLNMSPDLFKGVIANVPFVDVVTTMLDETIPLTTSEYDEWGNPNDKIYYDYMLSYSPYDQVIAQDYPALLVTTGLHDSQVQYFEPAKWVAKLRDLKTDDHILIMKVNMEAGHGGASGRFERYRQTALEYSFMLDQLGIKQ